MKYLIDTHVLLWVLFEDEKLSKKAKAAIKNPHNEIYVSMISYWEISLKYGLGKLTLKGITPDILPEKAKEIDVDTLTITEEEVSTFYQLPKLNHKDPFDRLIIWQAINKNLPLISRDKPIKDYQQFGLKVFW